MIATRTELPCLVKVHAFLDSGISISVTSSVRTDLGVNSIIPFSTV